MTPVDRAVLYLFVLFFIFALYQMFVRGARCSYCGKVNAHEDTCPYGRVDR